jgi:hypothetical protein
MPAGLQVFNDSGTFQIDSVRRGFALDRKLSVPTGAIYYGSYYATFAIGVNEVVALACDYPVAVVSNTGGTMTVVAPSAASVEGGAPYPGGTTVTAYIFNTTTQQGLGNYGLEVFDETGARMFNSCQGNLCMRAFVDGEGAFFVEAGRSFAAICSNQSVLVVDSIAGAQPNLYRIIGGQRGMVRRMPGGMVVEVKAYYGRAWTFAGSGPASVACSSPLNRHILVDVTGF